jgi:hypothetical protein
MFREDFLYEPPEERIVIVNEPAEVFSTVHA